MHFSSITQVLLLIPAIASALSIPLNPVYTASGDHSDTFAQRLEKRRGGGGHGSGGGRGGGSSGSASSGSGARSGSTSSSPSFGGGRSYPGGSSMSYSAGGRSPGGIAPTPLLAGGALGFGAGALFLYGAYSYPYSHPYYYVDPNTHRNDSLPVDCLCSPYNPCGCDDTNNQTLVTQMLQNSSVANVTTVNGTKTVVINGTLPNGTSSAGASLRQGTMDVTGYWVMASIVAAIVWGF